MILKLSRTCREIHKLFFKTYLRASKIYTTVEQPCFCFTPVLPSLPSSLPHQTVSLQSFDEGAVRVLVQREAIGNVAQEVQVLKSGSGLLPLLFGRSPLIRGALQVKLEVHAYSSWQNVVHHNNPDILAPALDAVEAKELWQQRPGILVQVLERGGDRRWRERKSEENKKSMSW